jgi:NADPH2:quinone reductase
VFEESGRVASRLLEMGVDDLSAGDVLIRASWSGLNYKDALALTGRGKILKRFPLNAGIDVAGTVEASSDPALARGAGVIVNGMGLGETHDGGLAEFVRVPAAWVVPQPPGLSPFEAMVLGTAGFTAALALHRMEQLGQRPDQGPMVVTGASGGVGSVAVSILSAKGYRTVAVSGRREHHAYLASLGAAEVVTPDDLALGARALESARFGGVIDNVGGALLAGFLRHVGLWGNVASVGNAGGPAFDATVFPFILRGVSLLGISSANCPMPLRTAVWRRLGADLKPAHLSLIGHRVIDLDSAIGEAAALLDRRRHGRIVVRIGA